MEVRENQAGLALLVIDHGLIYGQKGFQRDTLVFGVEHAKTTVYNSMFQNFSH